MLVDLKRLEEKETTRLADYAVKSAFSDGRKYPEKNRDDRLCFQRDKDRILHCKAFRRLNEKTQVFMAGTGDHYRTRLTHTLEVAQISRDLARRLELNEDLAEAIALAHDLGHPPFGHGGEAALDEVMQQHGMSFEHNEQSRRIVEYLEKLYPEFDGLNLSRETIEGMMKHQTAFDQDGKKFEKAAHLEAQIVNIADEIAYTNHDMDDGIRSGLITIDQLRKCELWQVGEAHARREHPMEMSDEILAYRTISAIIGMMIDDLCKVTQSNLEKHSITSPDMVREFQGSISCFSPEMKLLVKELREFLYNDFYMHPTVVERVEEGKMMIKKLFAFYLSSPEKMVKKHYLRDDDLVIIQVKDYLAGMTDGFLASEFQNHFKN